MGLFGAKRAKQSGTHDAYWQIPGAEHVALSPELSERPLDDRGRVTDAWTAAVQTLKSEAHESDAVRARIIAEVKRFERDYTQTRADRTASSYEG